MRLFKTRPFIRFATDEGISDQDLIEAALRAEAGLIDADLGGGLIKQRVARQGKGKSGGFRTLLAFKAGEKVFFLHGFAKNKRDNIDQAELKNLKLLAKTSLLYDNKQLAKLISDRELMEIYNEI